VREERAKPGEKRGAAHSGGERVTSSPGETFLKRGYLGGGTRVVGGGKTIKPTRGSGEKKRGREKKKGKQGKTQEKGGAKHEKTLTKVRLVLSRESGENRTTLKNLWNQGEKKKTWLTQKEKKVTGKAKGGGQKRPEEGRKRGATRFID